LEPTLVIEPDVFASALVGLLNEDDGDRHGSTTELLHALTARVADKVRRSVFWPVTIAATTAALNRVKDALESVGFTFEHGREGPKNDRRYLQFSRLPLP
jgi:hypothetical protein